MSASRALSLKSRSVRRVSVADRSARRLSRTREYQADASGAHLTHNPLFLANALRKLEAANERMPMDAGPATAHLFIVNPLSAQGLTRLFSTHPPIEERIRRLEHMAASGEAV